jgi:Lon protease-like protein
VSETSAPETPTDLDGDIIQDVETVDLPEVLPVLPLRGHVLFPIMLLPLGITEESSIQLVDDALAADRFVVLATQREGEEEAEGAAGVYDVGTAATIVRMSRGPDGGMRLLVQGIRRVRLTSFEQEEPYLTARAETLEEIPGSGTELEALRRGVIDLFRTLVSRVPQAPPEVMAAVEGIDEPGRLADFAASNLSMPVDRKQAILAEPSVEERLRELVTVLTREVEVLEIGSEIQEKVKSSMDKRGREAFLREQLKAIQDELGEGDAQSAEVDELRERIEAAGLPEEARKVAETTTGWRRSRSASSSTWPCSSGCASSRGRSSAWWGRPASARPRSDSRSPAPPTASLPACRWAACATRPRSAGIGAPTSARCRARSSSCCPRRARATPSSCSTRSTRWRWTSAATQPRRCSRSSIRSRTTPSTITTSRSTSTCPR